MGSKMEAAPPVRNLPGLIGNLLGIRMTADVYQLQQIATALAVLTDDPVLLEQAIDFMVKLAGRRDSYHTSVQLPDLASQLGEKTTEKLLLKLFLETRFRIQIASGTATEKLARQVALQNIDKLNSPQWELLHALDASTIPLYEAMRKRFPSDAGIDYAESEATGYYLVALVLDGRPKEALAILQAQQRASNDSNPRRFTTHAYTLLSIVSKQGAQQQVWNFLNEALSQDPSLPVWDAYRTLGAHVGKTSEVVKLAERWSTDGAVVNNSKGAILDQLYRALMASGRTDEARKIYPDALAALLAAQDFSSAQSLAKEAALAAELLCDKAWRDEAIQSASESLLKQESVGSGDGALTGVVREISRKEQAWASEGRV